MTIVQRFYADQGQENELDQDVNSTVSNKYHEIFVLTKISSLFVCHRYDKYTIQ